MRRLSAFIVVLFLLSTAAPIMACATGSAMTQAESACCRSMHGDCGDMAAMGCCQKQLRTDNSPQLATSAPSVEVQWTAVTYLPQLADRFAEITLLVSRVQLQAPLEHSPPGLRIAKITVLRI
jgi:hypothetical protein